MIYILMSSNCFAACSSHRTCALRKAVLESVAAQLNLPLARCRFHAVIRYLIRRWLFALALIFSWSQYTTVRAKCQQKIYLFHSFVGLNKNFTAPKNLLARERGSVIKCFCCGISRRRPRGTSGALFRRFYETCGGPQSVCPLF